MDDAEFLREKIKELTHKLDERSIFLAGAISTIREIGSEHWIAEKYLLSNADQINIFGKELVKG